MKLYMPMVASVLASENPLTEFVAPAAVTTPATTTRTLISHAAVDELVDALDDNQTMRLLAQFNADGEISRKEKSLILKIGKEKRRLEKEARKRERKINAALGRKRRMPSKCEENLPMVENGRWSCNGKSEACQLECDPDFLRNVWKLLVLHVFGGEISPRKSIDPVPSGNNSLDHVDRFVLYQNRF